jgi:hypothetical protein
MALVVARQVWTPALRRAFCPRHLGAGAASLASHAAAFAGLVWLSSHAVGVAAGGGAPKATVKRTFGSLTVFAPTQSANTNAAAQNERPSDKPLLQAGKEPEPVEAGIEAEPGEGTLTFSDFTLDVEKLLRRRTALFPFLTRTLSFNLEKPRKARPTPLVNPFATQPANVQEPPLVLSEAEVRRLVDESWSRRRRWAPFQRLRALVDVHHPDVGQVPALLRGYVTQNALQPYVERKTRDPRMWAQLELAADHELFVDFIADYVSRHPRTRGSIELLFLLDLLAQASLDTLQAMMEMDPARDLKWTLRTNAPAFDAFVGLRDYYMAQRRRRGLESYRALARHYDQIRTMILTTIVQTAPDDYRVNDARYLLGEINWRRGRQAEAKRLWSQMRADPLGRYAEARDSLLRVLGDAALRRRAAPPPDPRQRRFPWMRNDAESDIDQRAINAILETEYQAWVSASRVRLRHFGYALDAF